MGPCQLGGGGDHPSGSDERILGRRVPIGRRKERRALDVRVVVRAAGRDADQPDAQLPAQIEEAVGGFEVDSEP